MAVMPREQRARAEELDPEEARAIFDQLAHRELSISGAEFIRRRVHQALGRRRISRQGRPATCGPRGHAPTLWPLGRFTRREVASPMSFVSPCPA